MRFALLLLLAVCGGGGSTAVIPEPLVHRQFLVGYYYCLPQCVKEASGHTNLDWLGPGQTPTRASVLMLSGAYIGGVFQPQAIEFLKTADLSKFAVIYQQDEPNLGRGLNPNGVSASELAKGSEAIRAITDKPLWVIYGGKPPYPGWENFDAISVDDYDAGTEVLSRLNFPGKKIFVTVGGSDPWHREPKPYFDFCHSRSDCLGVFGFAWTDNIDQGVGLGIRSNGLKDYFCAAAKTAYLEAECT